MKRRASGRDSPVPLVPANFFRQARMNNSLTCRDVRSRMQKLFVPLVGLFLFTLTGCCSVFGLCASASVHSSIASPQTFAQQDRLQGLDFSQVGPLSYMF